MTLPPSLDRRTAPLPFHVMAKPGGAICNLDCSYCYYLSKELLYPGSRFRMAQATLDAYVRQMIEAQPGREVTFAWQGGEPTRLGIHFFEQALDLQRTYAPPGMRIVNTMQTNGTLLDDAWGTFLASNGFLVGISIDGPRALHDAYRVDKAGNGTFDRVMAGLEVLKRHGVAWNVLATVHQANAAFGAEVYRSLRDDVGASFMQFIPIVEPHANAQDPHGAPVNAQAVSGEQYGRFMTEVFDTWVRHDVGRVFVQLFDVALAAWLDQPRGLCVFESTCGSALALEHTGDVYSCDHFVNPEYHLGNLHELPLVELATSERQRAFGAAKRDTLPAKCRRCKVRFVCNGGCPKDRTLTTPLGEPGLNYLCAGYEQFFTYVGPYMREMVAAIEARRPPSSIQAKLPSWDAAWRTEAERLPGDAPCPCGNGANVRACHGKPSVGPQVGGAHA